MQHRNASLISPSGEVTFAWLIGLRWSALVGQLSIILLTHFLLMPLSLAPLLGVLLFEAVFNAGCALWLRLSQTCGPAVTAFTLLVDVLVLTALLYFSGGPGNPFNFLYLVHLTLAVVILGGKLAWGLWGVSLMGFGFLFLVEPPGAALSHHGGMHHGHHGTGDDMALHLKGMWVAFAVAGSFIIYFVDKVKKAMREQQREIAELRQQEGRQQRLASLATLSAGAAHELSTPLGTIAVVTGELHHSLKQRPDCGDLLEDLELVQSELRRCHDVLSQMAVKGGQTFGARITTVPLVNALNETIGRFNDAPIAMHLPEGSERLLLTAPEGLFNQALHGVLGNALNASSETVKLELLDGEPKVTIVVSDTGCGMNNQTLERATEPFFTTRPVGKGMGLGLFLTQTIVHHLGGTLELQSTEGVGTVVRMTFPPTIAGARP